MAVPTFNDDRYARVLADVVQLLEAARRTVARSVNTVMTLTYWEIGRRIVEQEQAGEARADYGDALLKRLAEDLTAQLGRGFARRNLYNMRSFFLAYKDAVGLDILSAMPTISPSSKRTSDKLQKLSAKSDVPNYAGQMRAPFALPWSHYLRLITLRTDESRQFYETEAVRGGWTLRQLERQINSQFYERTLLSRNQAKMLADGQKLRAGDEVSIDEEIKDPYVLEFLNLKDEYSESDLEAALVENIETFLMELGGEFAFIGRQRRLRIDDEWYRIDLLFFHRRLKSLVVIDLKLGKFTHADAGQMHLYLNYAREHWVVTGENPPIGIILCATKSETLVKYALEGLPNKIIAAEYRMALPSEAELAARLNETRRRIESRIPKD